MKDFLKFSNTLNIREHTKAIAMLPLAFSSLAIFSLEAGARAHSRLNSEPETLPSSLAARMPLSLDTTPMIKRSPNPNNLVIPIDSLAVTLNLANDLTGANADVRVPIDGYPRLVGDLYRGTSIADTTTSQEDNRENDTKCRAGRKEKKQEHIYATSGMLTHWPTNVTFRCYLDSGERRIGVLDHEHTSVIMLKDWNLKKKARSGLVDVADATIKCKM